MLVASILADTKDWIRDIRARELREDAAERIKTKAKKVIVAVDMDDEEVGAGDEVEVAEGEEGEGDGNEIGIVMEVTDEEGETILDVKVDDGEVIQVQSSKVRLLRKAKKERSAEPRRRVAVKDSEVASKEARRKRLALLRAKVTK